MDKSKLHDIAQTMVIKYKGILAADESIGTIKKRFDSIHIPSTEENRRDWRHLLFSTTQAMKDNISGVILHDETIRQKTSDDIPLTSLIAQTGSLIGIKVDIGAKPMAGYPHEKITEGLDGLRERLQEYRELGAQFAKWRAIIKIEPHHHLPSRACILANVHTLARYTALCQENNIVPIIEPEVIMDGTHTVQNCFDVTSVVLKTLYEQLAEFNIYLEGTILKPNMIISGTECTEQASIEQVAQMTLDCFRHNIPPAVTGIVFLSGGQSDKMATAHLDAMNKIGNFPWKMCFSYGRALQATPLKIWNGKKENTARAQAAFAHRAKMNGLATTGQWNANLEN